MYLYLKELDHHWDNGLLPVWHQAITWTSADSLQILVKF